MNEVFEVSDKNELLYESRTLTDGSKVFQVSAVSPERYFIRLFSFVSERDAIEGFQKLKAIQQALCV